MKHGSSQTGKIPIFRERLAHLQGDMTITAFADKLGLSRQTVGFYLNGDRIPDALTLKQIAQACDVTSDFLLGISDIPSNNPDIKNAITITGLSEKAIQTIQQLKVPAVKIPDSPSYEDMQALRTIKFPYSVQQLDILDWLLSNPRFTLLLTRQLCEYRGNCQGYYAAKNTRENEVSELYKETQGDISKEIALRENGTHSITIDIFDIQDACDRKDLALLRVQRQFDDIIREIENTLVDKNAVIENDDQDYL